MGKKNKSDGAKQGDKRRAAKRSFEFLSMKFDNVDTETVKRHILYLIAASLIVKFLVVVVSISVFQSFFDLFDIQYYLQNAVLLTQGQYPYINTDFVYPILVFIPILIALIPGLVFQNDMAFVYSFQFLMVLCDLVIIFCIYLIGLKLYNEKMAYYSGLIYTAAFSSAYFVMTKYDAFPTALLMLAITFTVYGKSMKGYLSTILGFFTKVFPVLAVPFFILYNAKETSLKEEIVAAVKVTVPAFVVLFLPVFLLNPGTFTIYIPIRSQLGYYSNTATFMIYSWIHNVVSIGISIDTISLGMYIVMGAGILALLYAAFKIPGKDPALLIKLLLCAIVLTVVCARVRSPQYIVWFTPLICILAIDDMKKIAAFFALQVLAYIEFPLMFRSFFGSFYIANEYTQPLLSFGWMITLLLFTLEYLTIFICIWLVVNPAGLYRKIRKAQT
jgi:hypothetical protein